VNCRRAFLATLCSVFVSASLLAVGPAGTIVGTVSDPSGASVVKAKVTIRNQQTNAAREVETGASGEYSVPLLLPGLYQVTVEAAGFQRAVHKDIKLDVDQTVRVDLVLQVGQITQEVVVTGVAPLLQTETSAVGQVVDEQKVSRLPLNERNFLGFTLLVPGAQMPSDGSPNSTQGGAISTNGAREQSNDFLLDGADNNDPVLNQYTVLPSVEAIQEFKVQSSNSSAEFGRSGGAQINVVLKSGTNNFHGTVFEFVRNRKLDAKNFFDRPDCTPATVPGTCAEIPRLDRNQFGGSLGGPIRHNKTFFFIAYEGLRLRQATTQQATVPSQMDRVAALAAVPPPARNPAGLAVFNLYPAANVGLDLVTSRTFVASPVIRNSVNQFLFKGDHQAGRNDMLSGHYALFDVDRFNPYDPVFPFTDLASFGSFAFNRGHNLGSSWIHIIRSSLVNEFRVGFNRQRAAGFQESFGTSKSQELGFPDVLARPVDLGFPNVTVAGFSGIGEPTSLPQERRNNILHFADNLAWNPAFYDGRHHFKFGADIRHSQIKGYLDLFARGNWFFFGVFTGSPLQDLLLGLPSFALGVRGDTFFDFRATSLNFYFQDDLRVTPRFTLNLGLRYEYNFPPVEVRDRLSVPDFSANSLTCSPQPDCALIQVGTNGIPRGIYEGDTNNFAPRIGFAWRPLRTDRFAVRAAYGVFHDVFVLQVHSLVRVNPPFYSILGFPNFGTSTIQTIFNQPGFAGRPTLLMIARDFRDPYLQHWNMDLQYELLPDLVLDVGYVGSKGTGLASMRNLNQARPGGQLPFPQFGPVPITETRASSNYHSFQLRAEKRLRQGLTFLAAYTWSKSLDNASSQFGTAAETALAQDTNNLRAERGLSNFHTQHRFVLSYLYELPFGGGRKWLNQRGALNSLLGGWQLAGIWVVQSGRPFTVHRGIDQSGTGNGVGILADRPDQIANPFEPGPVAQNPDPACHMTVSQGGRAADKVRDPASWFNVCAFAGAPGRFGTAGRNTLIGPGFKNIDFSVLKDTPLYRETHRLQFRFEVFNLFNQPNFDIPENNFDSLGFGQVKSSNAFGNKPPRQIQVGLKYIF